MESVRTLMADIVDYAGLFPPAQCGMAEAVRQYTAYFGGDQRWMLGRFVVPLGRLDEFMDEAAPVLPRGRGDEPWRLSALVSLENLDEAIDRIFAFNQHHEEQLDAGLIVIDSIECNLGTASAEGSAIVDKAMRRIPEQLEVYFELPLGYDLRGVLTALAGTGGRAKIRTGGVSADMIPSAETVAGFIAMCSAADVAFKATAGLHMPYRGERALTYEADSASAVMHGFLNLFLAAAYCRRARMSAEEIVPLLEEQDPDGIKFTSTGVSWRQNPLTNAQLASARESFAVSFGSCSFDEPVESLRELNLLPEVAQG
ncbi:MAG: hypothetical protein AAGI30_10970 [Planctomycetota bacterium]